MAVAKKRIQINKQIATALLMIIVSVAAGFMGGYYGNRHDSDNNNQNQLSVVDGEGQLISKIAKQVGPSVVSINVQSTGVNNTFFGPQSYSQESAGSGFIVSEEGIVVTNRHVVPQGVQKVSVVLSDGTVLDDVSVVGRTNEGDSLDVAFLKINDKKGKTLTPARLGDSSKVEVGERVVAIGNALGQLQNTVTSGIISGYGRNVQAGDETGSTENLQNLFQTDAAINQGNSGGPLVNMNGEVIGINTAIAGNAQNIGFAIPVNDVKGLVNSVLKNGKLLRPYLGVRYISLNDEIAYQLNLETKHGAYIFSSSSGPAIVAGSPAEKAGLKEKDIIIKVDDTEVNEKSPLSSLLSQHSVGDKVRLSVIRDGKEINIETTLEAAPQN